MRNFQRVATALATVLLLAGLAACKTTSSPHQQVDDGAIKASVKAKLAADVRLSTLTNVEVNSTDGVVTLAGKVRSEEERHMAADVARSVDGVTRVNNELQVEHR
jgi:osmotically-inducible protein OsmY